MASWNAVATWGILLLLLTFPSIYKDWGNYLYNYGFKSYLLLNSLKKTEETLLILPDKF